MTGEEQTWYDIASHLHMDVNKVKRRTTSSQFVKWRVYLDNEWNRETKQDYNFAMIALKLHELFRTEGTPAELKDMLLPGKFTMKRIAPKGTEPEIATDEEREQAAILAKMRWGALLRLKIE